MTESFGRDTAYHVRLLVDHVPSMLAYWDRDLRCRFANRAYEVWFGVDPDSLIGTSIRDLLGPELFALNEPYMQAALRGEEQEFERIVPGRGGVKRHSLAHYIPDRQDGEVKGFLVQVTDVTSLKEAEAELRRRAVELQRANDLLRTSEAALRQAQRLGRIGSWEWEVGADITIWSEELYRIFGWDPSRLPPRRSEREKLYTVESWARLEAAIEGILRNGEPYAIELEYVRRDGSTGWIEARAEAVRDEHGQIAKLRGTAQDITVRWQAQQARLQRDVAEASNRNKTLFLSRVSHELRTPLNGILGFAQLIQRDAANDAKQRQRADLILQSGWHMLDLVEEILDLSAAELGQLRVKHMEVDLGEAMRHSLPRFIALAHEARVELIDRVPDDGSLRVFGDSTRMQQVINNLLSNAIKYNRPLGRVTVSAERMGGSIALTVEDTGIGMSEDQVSRLFMPFERLGAERTSVKGTGVGLALTKWLIELMGGSLVVHSRPDAGSTFTATFSAVSA